MKTAVIQIDELVAGQGYPVHLTVEDGTADWWKRPKHQCHLPENLTLAAPLKDRNDKDIDAALFKVEAIRSFLLKETTAEEHFAVIGSYLFQLLHDCKVMQKWQEEKKETNGAGLRTILDIRAPELRQLPWELLYWKPTRPFTDARHPIVRGQLKFDGKLPEPEEGWLRALIVVGSNPNDPDVDAEEEVLGIRSVLNEHRGTILEQVSERPTWVELQKLYGDFQPHILHFIGHGRSPNNDGNDGYLEINANVPWRWTVEGIGLLLQDWAPHLAIVNACRSSDLNVQKGVWTVTNAFDANEQVRAVIGMQADVRGAAAARLSGPLYRALAEGRALDVGLAEARRAMLVVPEELKRRDWALPQLLVKTPPDCVAPLRAPITSERRKEVRKLPPFSQVAAFIDREAERCLLGSEIRPAKPKQRSGLIVVTGQKQAGKSWLVCWSLEACKLWNWDLAYLDMKEERTCDSLQVLRRLYRALVDAADATERQNVRRAFNAFNHGLNHVEAFAEKREPPAYVAGPEEVIEETRYKADLPWPTNVDLDRAKPLIHRFRDNLKSVAQGRPLIIAIDALNVLSNHFNELLAPELFKPLTSGPAPAVRMILVLTQEQISSANQGSKNSYYEGWKHLGAQLIEVPLFHQRHWPDYARAYTRLRGVDLDEDLEQIIEVYSKKIKQAWSPGNWLAHLEEVFLLDPEFRAKQGV